MKISKTQFHANVHSFPELRFEDQRLSSFSGSVVLQAFFQKLRLKDRLQECFAHRDEALVVGFRSVVLILIVHLMLGYRRLRDIDRYREDPVVLRTLGLKRMPHISTISRTLSRVDRGSAEKVRQLSCELVTARLEREQLARVTMDFDGSVILHGKICRRHGGGIQHPQKRGEKLLPVVLHHRADGTGPGCVAPQRKRARFS